MTIRNTTAVAESCVYSNSIRWHPPPPDHLFSKPELFCRYGILIFSVLVSSLGYYYLESRNVKYINKSFIRQKRLTKLRKRNYRKYMLIISKWIIIFCIAIPYNSVKISHDTNLCTNHGNLIIEDPKFDLIVMLSATKFKIICIEQTEI